MGTGRREHGGRGSFRPVGVGVTLGTAVEGRLRRQLSASFIRRRSRDLNPDNSAVNSRVTGSRVAQSTGRPMPELFGVQDLSEFFIFY